MSATLPNPEIFHANLTAGERCPWCHDGFVYLGGTVQVGNGPVYDRGVVPCQWCERGEAIRAGAKQPHSDRLIEWATYTAADVDPAALPTSGKDRPSKAEIRGYVAKVKAMFAASDRRVMPPGPILPEDVRGMPRIARGPANRQPVVPVDDIADYIGEEPPPP